jgi:cytochrome c-type biogenesis protein CcmH
MRTAATRTPLSSPRRRGPIASNLEVKPGSAQRLGREAGGYGSSPSRGRRRIFDKRLRISLAALWFALAISSPAYAVQPDEIMSDPARETRARDLSRELRCMVCQNQSIDDSEAPLARDLRLLVRERIAAGDSDAQVMDFLVARYGEFVLLKPRLKSHTLLLWLLPPLALAGGGLALWAHARRRSKAAADDPSLFKLSADEEARIERLMAAEPTPEEKAV